MIRTKNFKFRNVDVRNKCIHVNDKPFLINNEETFLENGKVVNSEGQVFEEFTYDTNNDDDVQQIVHEIDPFSCIYSGCFEGYECVNRGRHVYECVEVIESISIYIYILFGSLLAVCLLVIFSVININNDSKDLLLTSNLIYT